MESKDCIVYWYSLQNHTDIFKQGYIGITQHEKRRKIQHRNTDIDTHFSRVIKKHGYDNLKYQVIFTGTTKECEEIELTLRSETNTGWNINIGGNHNNGELFKKPISLYHQSEPDNLLKFN